PQTSEDVFISSAAVTGYRLNVTTGGGSDTVVSGSQSDTISTGAGNDIVKLTSLSLSGGFRDFVDMGTGFDILDLSGAGANVVLNFDATNRLQVTTAVTASPGSQVDGWDRIIGNGGTMGVGAAAMLIYGATGTGTSLDDLANRMQDYTGLSIGYGQLFFGNNIAAYTGPLPNFTNLPGTFLDFFNGSLNFSQLTTGITINPGQNVKTAGGTNLFGANLYNYNVTGTGFDDHIDRSDAFTNGAGLASGHRFTLNGGDGNDYLKGGKTLNGGGGDDYLVASTATVGSTLTGGAGADIFELPSRSRTPGTSTGNTPYQVLDFNVADDTIYIAIGGGLRAVTVAEFHIGPAATAPEHRVIYNPATGALLYDPNGSDADLIGQGNNHFATLPTGLAPNCLDFFFI
ncbi:MAG TPA: hypothetical protein VMS43_06715, partial [Allosphingosinicella sp.]|nr:hypothetical protein [Allosphingosinicella sp.]